jgi:hypothetical protein
MLQRTLRSFDYVLALPLTLAPGKCDPGDVGPTACEAELTRLGVSFEPTTPEIEHPPDHPELDCTVENPVLLQPLVHGVSFRPGDMAQAPQTLYASCGLARAIALTAEELALRNVTDVAHFGTYGCKVISGTDTLSQHALGQAVDLASFRLESGDVISVLDDWSADPGEQDEPKNRFLHEFVQSLYTDGVYNVILTPDYNAEHENHFHLDLTPGVKFMQ